MLSASTLAVFLSELLVRADLAYLPHRTRQFVKCLTPKRHASWLSRRGLRVRAVGVLGLD